ncbi:hypothetical protein Micbo1qcDRAFT_41691 [Microdochium bolleyi]|uniref:DUF7600 domain-containing protein n=1 Tax=Microdochium bolleyi TaxID=196109 RepID=A0A136JAS5_9PEZI|nr:hypothetical protein Micbo1qcDRAFT_41691 [Microdochium bolleyi]
MDIMAFQSKPTWCSLCGVIITASHGATQHVGGDHELSWMSAMRIVRNLGNFPVHKPENQWDSFVSGIGWLDPRREAHVSADAADHWRCPQGEGFVPYRLYHRSKKYWCFPLHDVCWQLLRDKVGCDVEQNELARHLLLVFYNTPLNAQSRLAPGHNYGGASDLQNIIRLRGYFYQVRTSRCPHLIGNPCESLQADEHCLWEAVQAISAPLNRPIQELQDGPESASDPFSRFPYEVSMIVFMYLSSTDFCMVRLASRPAARIGVPQQLPQAFWRSRFYPDSELGFVFAMASQQEVAAQTDWRLLYFKARATLSESELFPGFRNRQRIWLCLQHIANAVKVRLRNPHCTNKAPFVAMEPPLLQGEEHGSWVCADAALAPLPTHPLATSDLASHCRVFEMQKLPWPASDGGRVTLKASFVDYCGNTYISGLQLERQGTGEAVRCVETAGFLNTTNFQTLVLDKRSKLERVEVGVCSRGLSGLRFHFEDQSPELDCTIGSLRPQDSQGGLSTLTVSENGRISGFVLGVDAFKVVSLSIMESVEYHDKTKAVNSTTNSAEFAPPSEVWTPDPPSLPVSWRYRSTRPSQLHNLCLNMDFGGHDAHRVRKLTQVVARMTRDPGSFVGMRFVYLDGTVTYGPRDGGFDSVNGREIISEQVFCIDGPGGEVIDRVTVSYSMEIECIRKIMVHTNHDRSMEFSLHIKTETSETLSVKIFEPEPGSTLSAFFSKIKMQGRLPEQGKSNTVVASEPQGHFRDFAIGSVSMDIIGATAALEVGSHRQVDHMIPVHRTTLAPVAMMLRHQGGFAITAADLSNIKRIRVCVGGKSVEPDTDMITGMWLEYHDSDLPVILGQWDEEIDSLEIQQDDRLVAIQIWHDFNNDTNKRLALGPVVGILFRTALGVEKKCARRYVVKRDCISFRGNQYEDITGIVWGNNQKWDHVWALVTPNPKTPRLLPVQGMAVNVEAPSILDTVYDKVLIPGEPKPQLQLQKQQKINPLVAIEVAFWNLDKVPNSLKLCFRHGPPRILGHPQAGYRPQTLALDVDAGEELVGMRLGVAVQGESSQIACITFTTNTGRELDFREEWWTAVISHITEWHKDLPLLVVFPFTQEAAAAEIAKARAQAEEHRAVVRSCQQEKQDDGAHASSQAPESRPDRSSSSGIDLRMGKRYGRPTTDSGGVAAHGSACRENPGAATGQASASSASASPSSPSASHGTPPAASTITTVQVDNVLSVRVVEPPKQAGRFVGLWALANHALEYPFIGPLFEEDSAGSGSPDGPGVQRTETAAT